MAKKPKQGPRNPWLEKQRAKKEAPKLGAARARVPYATPEALQALGPLLRAGWSVPPALADLLRAQNRPVPPPIVGVMLIDTGASRTCMAQDAAEELGLKPISLSKTYGVGGLHQNHVFEAHLTIRFRDGQGTVTSIEAEVQALGVPHLNDHAEIISTENTRTRMIGLLGRDFLRHCRLTYDGVGGVVDFSVDQDFLSRIRQQ